VAALEGQNQELLSKLSKSEADNVNKSTELSAVKTELSDIKSSAAAPSVKEKSIEINLGKNKKQTISTEKPFHKMSMKERIEYNLQNQK
jgi:hypothetical protein